MDAIKPTVMVVDDDPDIRRTSLRMLTMAGFNVHVAGSGSEALALITLIQPDVLVADVKMPGMSGIELFRRVRAIDIDMPVIFWTGHASVSIAKHAVRLGAFALIEKTDGDVELTRAIREAARMRQLALAVDRSGVRSDLQTQLVEALAEAKMAYQPIWDHRDGRVMGWELLLRPTRNTRLASPDLVLEAARRLHAVQVVAHKVRNLVNDIIESNPNVAVPLFVNIDPTCLVDPALYDTESPIAPHARRVVLEITEKAPLEGIGDLPDRLAVLRAIGYRIALDDFGAGHAGLQTLLRVRPQVLKIDMALVRDIDTRQDAKYTVKTVVALAHDLGIQVIAEGVENATERAVLESLGVDGLQGYWIAKPGFTFDEPMVV